MAAAFCGLVIQTITRKYKMRARILVITEEQYNSLRVAVNYYPYMASKHRLLGVLNESSVAIEVNDAKELFSEVVHTIVEGEQHETLIDNGSPLYGCDIASLTGESTDTRDSLPLYPWESGGDTADEHYPVRD
jgi:hypothetical protein